MVKPVWKCLVKGCDFTAPPTLEGFNEIVGHQLHHSLEGTPKEKRGFHLIDQGTGTMLARNLKKARAKGLLQPTSPSTPTPSVVPPGKTADSAYQQGYDKGYEEGEKDTIEGIKRSKFSFKCPNCAFSSSFQFQTLEKIEEQEEEPLRIIRYTIGR